MKTVIKMLTDWWKTPTPPPAPTPMVIDRVKLSVDDATSERWARESYPLQRLQRRFR